MKKEIGYKIIEITERIFGIEKKEIDLGSVEELIIQERYRENFAITKVREKPEEWIIELVERKERIPLELKGKEVVFNGYKDKIEIIDHTLQGKLVYLQFFRRKWKEKGGRESYSNTYELHPEGMKATKEFGDFLKALPRQERDEFFCTFPNIRHIKQKDF